MLESLLKFVLEEVSGVNYLTFWQGVSLIEDDSELFNTSY